MKKTLLTAAAIAALCSSVYAQGITQNRVMPNYPVIATASFSEPGNSAENAVDGKLSTRWSCPRTIGQCVLTLELDAEEAVNAVAVAALNGTSRMTFFDIQASRDGITFEHVGSYATAGDSNDAEEFNFDTRLAKYINIVGHGNSGSKYSEWTSLTEVSVYRVEYPVVKVTPSSVVASSYLDNPMNVVDGSLATRWSAEGKRQWISFTFPEPIDLHSARIAFYLGDTRHTDFWVKSDEIIWVGNSVITNKRVQYLIFDLGITSVTVESSGNSSNNWNSYTEISWYRWGAEEPINAGARCAP
jgi:hypothetical protein